MRKLIFFCGTILAAGLLQGCGGGGGGCLSQAISYQDGVQKKIPLGNYKLAAGPGSLNLEVTASTVTVTLLKDGSKTVYQVLERRSGFVR